MPIRATSAALVFALTTLPAAAQTPAADEPGVRAVVERFRTAILAKDKPGFLALFLDGPLVWQPVNADPGAAATRGGVRVPIDPARNPRSFIDGIVASKARHEETFDNLRIDSDGAVASVSFDFAYLVDGRAINRGKEAWHLVRTDAGWRIVSVIYSNHRPR